MTPELRTALAAHKATVLPLRPSNRFVTLGGGLAVPVVALRLALRLEAQGIPLATDTDHQFMIPDDPRLSAADLGAIQHWRLHLGAIAKYRPPEI